MFWTRAPPFDQLAKSKSELPSWNAAPAVTVVRYPIAVTRLAGAFTARPP